MLLIIIGLLIGKSERYSIGHICACLKDIGKKRVGKQVQRPARREAIHDLVRRFICSQERRIVEYKLYTREHLGLERGVFKGINKET